MIEVLPILVFLAAIALVLCLMWVLLQSLGDSGVTTGRADCLFPPELTTGTDHKLQGHADQLE